MSKHLPECAGDNYCRGDCRYDGIIQLALLERASDISCDCHRSWLYHDRHCSSSPAWADTVAYTDFDPNAPLNPRIPIRITETWVCIKHGKIGEINGPVHYEVCSV